MSALGSILVLSPWLLAIGAAWLLGMVSVPLLKRYLGPRGEQAGIEWGVISQVGLVAGLIISTTSDPTNTVRMLLVIPAVGWLAEYIGSSRGFPFGPYKYTPRLQPQIKGVPLFIPLAWLMMMPPSWAVGMVLGQGLFPGLGPGLGNLVALILGAIAMTAWDFYLDTQMVAWNFWVWEKPGAYFGIPLQNFAGWLGVSFLISLLAQPVISPEAAGPLLVIYGITWIMEFIAQMFFWNLKGSAVVGFAIMGTLIVPALMLWH